jgi:hypothetical protein
VCRWTGSPAFLRSCPSSLLILGLHLVRLVALLTLIVLGQSLRLAV